MISAKIIKDSVNPCGNRLTTFLLKYPRIVHSELMTHRAFSRNAASSRAIPIEKMIGAVMDEPALPVSWGKNQKGMQAAEELDPETQKEAVNEWLGARNAVMIYVRHLVEIGVHKQIANRPLESWMHMQTLVSATDYDNFFSLRSHKDADPTFQALADRMLYAYVHSVPEQKKAGEWHMPFADQFLPDSPKISDAILRRITVARAARTSYKNFEGSVDIDADLQLTARLEESGHWSPFEHIACAIDIPIHSGNFVGWEQFRKMFPGECRKVDVKKLLEERIAAGSKYACPE